MLRVMDRERLITEMTAKGIPTDEGCLPVVEILGRGGNGVAFLCSGETSGKLVAKVYIPPDKRDLDDQSLERFRNEVKLASKIRHPYIIPATGSGTAHVGALPFLCPAVLPHAPSRVDVAINHRPAS